MKLLVTLLAFALLAVSVPAAAADTLPRLEHKNGRHALLVNGEPFLILGVQANNSSLSDGDRKAIAAELRGILDGLLSMANSTDGTGRYLFAGSADDSAPFSRTTTGVAYNGDQTQRRVELAPETFIADTSPGNLRADYVLPRVGLRITGSGVFWPVRADPLSRLTGVFDPQWSAVGGFPTSDHRLVWIDLRR